MLAASNLHSWRPIAWAGPKNVEFMKTLSVAVAHFVRAKKDQYIQWGNSPYLHAARTTVKNVDIHGTGDAAIPSGRDRAVDIRAIADLRPLQGLRALQISTTSRSGWNEWKLRPDHACYRSTP
jgi:hypothetical protein